MLDFLPIHSIFFYINLGKKNIDISFYDQPIPSCNYTVKYYEGLDKERGDQNGYGKK